MRTGLAVAVAAACLLGWSAIEVRAAAANKCRRDEPATCDEGADQEKAIIYPREFIRAPEAVFRYRCRHEYWKAVLVGLRPFYPGVLPQCREVGNQSP